MIFPYICSKFSKLWFTNYWDVVISVHPFSGCTGATVILRYTSANIFEMKGGVINKQKYDCKPQKDPHKFGDFGMGVNHRVDGGTCPVRIWSGGTLMQIVSPPQILSRCKILSTTLLALQCRKMCFLFLQQDFYSKLIQRLNWTNIHTLIHKKTRPTAGEGTPLPIPFDSPAVGACHASPRIPVRSTPMDFGSQTAITLTACMGAWLQLPRVAV